MERKGERHRSSQAWSWDFAGLLGFVCAEMTTTADAKPLGLGKDTHSVIIKLGCDRAE